MNPVSRTTHGTLTDCAAAVASSFAVVAAAAGNAVELLHATGNGGAAGDTADDLRCAVESQQRLLNDFCVMVRTAASTEVYQTKAKSSFDAFEAAALDQGETPCAISVHPTEPDRASLEAARKALRITAPLETALSHPTLGVAVRTYARKPPRRKSNPQQIDFKSLAANDRD